MEENLLQETSVALQHDWGLQLPEQLSEEAILHLLAQKIIAVLERGPEVFFHLMYRLDVSEKKLNEVMLDQDVAEKIARLVYDRQLQKIQSRQVFQGSSDDNDPELKW